MGDLLLQLEDIQRFGEQALPAEILFFPLPGHLLGIFRDHFGPVNDIEYEFSHTEGPWLVSRLVPPAGGVRPASVPLWFGGPPARGGFPPPAPASKCRTAKPRWPERP